MGYLHCLYIFHEYKVVSYSNAANVNFLIFVRLLNMILINSFDINFLYKTKKFGRERKIQHHVPMYRTGILTVKDKEPNQNDAKCTCPDRAAVFAHENSCFVMISLLP